MIIKNKSSFAIIQLLLTIICLEWYQQTLFRAVKGCSTELSTTILYGVVIASIAVELFFEINSDCRKTAIMIFFNLSIAFGIYTVLAYEYKIVSIISVFTAGSALVSFLIVMLLKKGNSEKPLIQNVDLKVERSLKIMHRIVGVGMTFIIIAVGIITLTENDILYSSSNVIIQSKQEGQTIENNIDKLELLGGKHWLPLSAQERIDVLQVVVEIEQCFLGLTHELNISAEDLSGTTLACYCEATHQITVDVDHLKSDNPERVLCSLLHEVRHAFQHCCINAADTIDPKYKSLRLPAYKYAEEFSNYKNEGEEYASQSCEVDARAYAETRSKDYIQAIDDLCDANVIEDSDNKQETYSVDYEDGYAYLIDSCGTRILGPYLYIDFNPNNSYIFKYIGLNGEIGYLDLENEAELTPPIFVEASEMRDGKALVSEAIGSVYYINSSGERISGDYLDGFEYEHQGLYARVKDETGYGIINANGELIFSGAQSISELPSVTELGSAVNKDGHAILFWLNTGVEDDEFHIIREFHEFSQISRVYYGSFAVVENEKHLQGIIDHQGNILFDAEYKMVDFDVITDEDNSWYGDHIRFILQKEDGTYIVEEIDFGAGIHSD